MLRGSEFPSAGPGSRGLLLVVVALLAITAACTIPARRLDIVPAPPPRLYEWIAPSAVRQLEADDRDIPPGYGAVLVPTMTHPDDEPDVLVFQDGEEVADGPTGRRIFVPPGPCVVRVGSGSVSQTVAVTSEVHARMTALVPVRWGGLVLEVVDENNVPYRGSYELIRVSDREVLGIGLGADTLLGERLRTWLLEPGLYRIVQPGSTYRTRTDFATVHIPQNSLVFYKLVINPNTGEFRGAGVVAASEMSTPTGIDPWTRRVVVGVNAGMAQSSGLVGVADQTTISGDLFWDNYLAYELGSQSFIGLLELEEGLLLVNPAEGGRLPLQKSRDRLRLDLVYTYLFADWIGPYVAVGTIASVFPTHVISSDPITIRRLHEDGTTEDEFVGASESFRTSDFFGSVQVREGLGVNLRFLRTAAADMSLRIGAGFRQNVFHDSFVEDDLASTDEIEYRQVESFNQEGIESVLAGRLRFLRFLTYTTEAEVFADFGQLEDPTITWQNTLSFRFTSFAALDYSVDLLSQPQVVDDLQLSQSILLRLAWSIL